MRIIRFLKTGTIRFWLIFSVVFFNICAFSQIPVPKKAYLHLKGTINRDLTVTMDLVKINDTMYGEFYFSGDSKVVAPGFQEGSIISFSGNTDSRGNAMLVNSYEGQDFIIKARFISGQVLSGTFETRKSGKKFPIELREQYNDGSIPLYVYFQEGSQPIVRKPKAPVAHIGLSLLLPGESSNVLSDTVKKIILSRFIGKQVRTLNQEMIMNGTRQVYFENYITTNESIYKEGMGQSFSWEYLKYTHVVLNEKSLLVFYIENYSFTGGAHGMQTREYTSVNLKTGKVITLKDLLKPGYEKILTRLLSLTALKDGEVPQGQSLKDAGFFVDEIEPNENFYLTPGGLGFFYNHYEIAPYANGPENFFIPFDDLARVLNKDGVLSSLLK